MTSVHEDWPMPGNTAYCLSKGGMRMLTRTAGVELAPHNILVVGVGPGAVDTPINTATVDDPAALAKLDNAIPIGRLAEPEEIASVVAFLAGDGASYLTATTIFADGGHHAEQPGPLISGRHVDCGRDVHRRPGPGAEFPRLPVGGDPHLPRGAGMPAVRHERRRRRPGGGAALRDLVLPGRPTGPPRTRGSAAPPRTVFPSLRTI